MSEFHVKAAQQAVIVSHWLYQAQERSYQRKRSVLAACTSGFSAMSMGIEAGGELRTTSERRRRSTEERRLIVEETLEPEASVARVARKHGVNANQVTGWRKLYESGRLGVPASGMTLLPVTRAEEQVLPRLMPEPVGPAPSGSSISRCLEEHRSAWKAASMRR